MDYVFRIGPVESTEGESFLYFIDSGEEEALSSIEASKDEDALRQIAEARPGRELHCEHRLEAAGKDYGFVGADPDPRQQLSMGSVVFDRVLGKELDKVENRAALHEFAKVCSQLWQAKPWGKPFHQQVLKLALSGAKKAVWELTFFGEVGEECGVILYPKTGLFARVQALAEKGKLEEAARLGSLVVSFEGEPSGDEDSAARHDWIGDAFSTAYGLPLLPHPIKVANGERAYVDDTDLIILAAALQAAATFGEGDPATIHKVRGGDIEVGANLSL